MLNQEQTPTHSSEVARARHVQEAVFIAEGIEPLERQGLFLQQRAELAVQDLLGHCTHQRSEHLRRCTCARSDEVGTAL